MKEAGLLTKENSALDVFMEGDTRGFGQPSDKEISKKL